MTDSTRSESRSDDGLKPCPFCGEQPALRQLERDGWEINHRCGALTVSVVYWMKERVISSWNRRFDVSELGTVSTYDVLVDARDCIENLTALVEKPAPTYVEPCLQRIEVAMETLGEKSLLPSSGERSGE